ncbi:MAG: LemA family protein [Candidatus Blackburnbacteria bacterium]|nr:LemA family protein [Candidatus Blackburnbacteria bacterium]
MSPILIGIIVAIVLVAGYVLLTYNNFVTTRVRIKASIQEIGNQLKRQAGLIPNLESSAKAYLKHEKDIFEKLTEARKAVLSAQKSGSIEDAEKASQLISGIIPSIRILVESNPEMKGADVVRQLMEELRDTADKIMYSRRTLIDLAADYNSLRVQFPSSLIASAFGFGEEKGLTVAESGEHIEVSDNELKTPKVSL